MPQPRFGAPLDRYFNPKEQGEDALTLEVQTPELGLSGLPVMVWIHGGGFITGAGSAQANDGYAFARDGIVHVSINYRLGIDGFALFQDSIDTGTDNLGIRDQIAALEWVQRNIAFFGGDPDNVTIAGQSTGASGVAFLLACPAAQGLFSRALSQSGSPTLTKTADEALEIGKRLGELAGIPPTRAAFAQVPMDDLMLLTQRIFGEVYGTPESWIDATRIPVPFSGVTGTETLPEPVIPAVRGGSAAGVQILAGTTKDETVAIFRDGFSDVTIDSPRGRSMLSAFGANADTIASYRDELPSGASDLTIISAIATEIWARKPTVDLLEAHDGADFLYEFTWESPMLAKGTGAVQGMDIAFANDDFENMQDVPRGARMLGNDPSSELARRMHNSFADFVKVGDPGWDAYTSESRVSMRFDAECAAQSEPAHRTASPR
jgi:para-nitrobenzyl esterase